MADRGGRGGRGGERGGRGGRGGERGGRGGDRGGRGGDRGGRGGDRGGRGGDRGGRGGERGGGLPFRGGDAGRGDRGGRGGRGGRGTVSGDAPRGGGDFGRGGGPPPQQAAGGSGGPGRGGRGFRGGPRGNQRGRGGNPPSDTQFPFQGQPAAQDLLGFTLPERDLPSVALTRPGFATSGRTIQVRANAFPVTVPEGYIYQYDVAILPDQPRAIRANMEIIKRLQEVIAPTVFHPRASYDGKKIMYRSQYLFNQEHNEDFRAFDVTLEDPAPTPGARPPKVYKVKITRASEINAIMLHNFVNGHESADAENSSINSALQALNVVLRMDPTMRYPFNTRSFYTDKETVDIRVGIELWRGYFQSVRASSQRLLVNVDISTAMMYKRGPLIDTARDHLRGRDMTVLIPGRGLNEIKRRSLQTFLSGCRVLAESAADPTHKTKRTIMKISKRSATELMFESQGQRISVADYFRQLRNGRPLRHPELPCIELGNGALIPFECCEIIPGQILRKQLPHDKTKDMVEFATMRPAERLNSIVAGLPLLNYAQSEYLEQFGMTVDTTSPVQTSALVINAPTMRYGADSMDPRVQPRFGAWNMVEKTFWQPKPLARWIVISFDERRFTNRDAPGLIGGLVRGMSSVGMEVQDQRPDFYVHSPQSDILRVLDRRRQDCITNKGGPPGLIVVVLPDGGDDIYVAVKHWGDVVCGVPTQCLQSKKCGRANMQYWANVCLKINAKLGGTNTLPESSMFTWLSDPHNPTLVLGADVAHAAPDSDRPSYAALTGCLDSNVSKYTAIVQPQRGIEGFRRESIMELKDMAKHVIQQYVSYRRQMENKPGASAHPKRILFYRDGVDEGQFKDIKRDEIGAIEAALRELNIDKVDITFIIVAKRHHLRFFPVNPNDGDRNGNLPAGTLIDQGVTHPIYLDFYLYSHSGILGTSRPSHYTVLRDDSNLSVNQLINVSYLLCHTYARSTRSVSIPAPVYYAHNAAARAKYHYDPSRDPSSVSQSTVASASREAILNAYCNNFRPLHPNQYNLMYFM